MASSGWVEDAKGALDALADVVDGELAGDAPRVLAAHHPTARWYDVGPDGTLSSGLVADASARPFARVDRAAPPASIPAHARRMNRVVETGRLEGAPGTPQNGVLVWARCETCVPASDDDAPGGPPRLEHASLLLVLFKCPEGWRVISHVREARDVTDRAGGFGPDVPPAALVGDDAAQDAAARADDARAGAMGAVADYFRFGHAADADAMPGCYHPGTRLTAPAPDLDAASSPAGHAGVFLIPFDDFMRRVGARPNTEEDPRVKRYDNRCVAFSSGGSSSALVVCHIAYPPILFTDVLTLLEFADEPGGERRWRIVCKSSVSAKCPKA